MLEQALEQAIEQGGWFTVGLVAVLFPLLIVAVAVVFNGVRWAVRRFMRKGRP